MQGAIVETKKNHRYSYQNLNEYQNQEYPIENPQYLQIKAGSYDFKPKFLSTQFNYHFITTI